MKFTLPALTICLATAAIAAPWADEKRWGDVDKRWNAVDKRDAWTLDDKRWEEEKRDAWSEDDKRWADEKRWVDEKRAAWTKGVDAAAVAV